MSISLGLIFGILRYKVAFRFYTNMYPNVPFSHYFALPGVSLAGKVLKKSL